jgi:hypothetical protein
MRVFSVKRTSLTWSVVPVVVILGGVVVFLVGLVGAATGKNWAPILILIGLAAALVMTMGWVTVVRRVEIDTDGTVRFKSIRRLTTCQLGEVRIISTSLPPPDGNWPFRVQTPRRVVHLSPALTELKELVEAIRSASSPPDPS